MLEQVLKNKRTAGEIATVAVVLVLGLSVLGLGERSKGNLTYNEGELVYVGDVKHHRMDGYGRLEYANGDVYEGEFVRGVFNGQGTFTSSTGWTYEGEFKNGQADGEGKLIAKDKQIYQGTFKQGIYQK